MTDPAFFGFGSLVNLATHTYAAPYPAQLTGWRRVWRHTPEHDFAYLSVERNTTGTIAGIIALVPGGDWAALDLRETGYLRRDITNSTPHNGPLAIYEVDPELTIETPQKPILLSYLDVVIQGYENVFGATGVIDFFATTHGWDTPVLDDRSAPKYPRHQKLSAQQTALVDGHLDSLSAVMQKL